jgi:hypothetical protein
MSNPSHQHGMKSAVAVAFMAMGFVCSCEIVAPFDSGDCIPNYGADDNFGGQTSCGAGSDSPQSPRTALNNRSKQSFSFITAGGYQTCGLKSDQTIECWGGTTSAPEGHFVSVSAGHDHACAIKSDQTLLCWGEVSDGQVPAPGGHFVSVSAGWNYFCGVEDGHLCVGVKQLP